LPGDELLQVERAFCMGQTEVTVGQWNAVMGGAPPESEAGLNLPKVRVTPDDARDFAEKLSELDPSGRYRLPSPMEWEYAARAGARTRYFFGASGEDLHEYGNCKNDLGDDGYDELAPVCKFKPNAWGLCDVHGNAAEWVETTGPTQPEKAARRMGGSWMNPEQNCAFGSLLSEVIGNPDYQTGFRLVREIAE
jgi:formylglycine-generating enzyme required for sulfatase activity